MQLHKFLFIPETYIINSFIIGKETIYSTGLNKDWYGFGGLHFSLKIISDKYTNNFKYKVIAIPFKIRQKTSKPKTHKPKYYQISVQDNKNHC